MKRFIFQVEDRVTREVIVLAKSEDEALEKLENWDVEDEWEKDCDIDYDTVELMEIDSLDSH